MNYPKIDPSAIDLDMALEMTLWSDHEWVKREPKRLTYKSNYFPKVIDFEELVRVKPPKGFSVEVFSRDLKIETTSYRGVCPRAIHYYCHIKFYGPSLIRGGCSIAGATGVDEGRIFGMHTMDINRPVTDEDLADKYADWTGYKVGDMTHRWYDTENAIECAKRIVELRFRNYGELTVEDCNE